jgi:hypothetical protein
VPDKINIDQNLLNLCENAAFAHLGLYSPLT